MPNSTSLHTPPLGATIHQLKIKPIFDDPGRREKLYAHYFARAAWHGSRIIMRQVSPESTDIFDFSMSMYKACDGSWEILAKERNVTDDELSAFLEYAAMFLRNLGNFYGKGDQKFVPDLTEESLEKLAGFFEETRMGLEKFIGLLLAVPPCSLVYPSKNTQSGYHPSKEPITQDEIANVSEIMNSKHLGPETLAFEKSSQDGRTVLQLLQASAEKSSTDDGDRQLAEGLFLIRGDHS